jgi:cell division protein ZapA (FtsZ GTPase activity inhibitor)
VKVEIMGQEYRFISKPETPAEYIHQIAGYVDSQMRKLSRQQPTLDIPRIAVLTAVNIADEYFRLRAEAERSADRVEERIAALEQQLGEAERRLAESEKEKAALAAELEQQREKERALADELAWIKEQSARMSQAAQEESDLREAYRKLEEEYRKLQNEFNEWLDMVDLDRAGH